MAVWSAASNSGTVSAPSQVLEQNLPPCLRFTFVFPGFRRRIVLMFNVCLFIYAFTQKDMFSFLILASRSVLSQRA